MKTLTMTAALLHDVDMVPIPSTFEGLFGTDRKNDPADVTSQRRRSSEIPLTTPDFPNRVAERH